MKLSQYRKVWWALYAGLLIMLLVNLVWGVMGLQTQERQKEQIMAMQQNYEQLKAIQGRLEATKYDYENNDETIILAARKVGFFRRNESLIVVRGLDANDEQWEVGYVIFHPHQLLQGARWYGVFAFIIGFCLILTIQFLFHKNVD